MNKLYALNILANVYCTMCTSLRIDLIYLGILCIYQVPNSVSSKHENRPMIFEKSGIDYY